MASGAKSPRVVPLVGTGADMIVDSVGFKPRVIDVLNVDTGDRLEWRETMADDSAVKTLASNGVNSVVTTDGITPRDAGFALGADSDVNAAGKAIVAVCWE